jgi:hypothetical protein
VSSGFERNAELPPCTIFPAAVIYELVSIRNLARTNGSVAGGGSVARHRGSQGIDTGCALKGIMKRGGIALAVLLAISGVLRVAGPGASSGGQSAGSGGGRSNKHQPVANPNSAYQQDLYNTIQDFYGYWPDAPVVAASAGAAARDEQPRLLIPDCARTEIQFVVAILPDPVHTRLGLFFDRSMEALQQAAQKQHYAFDRAVLPWDRNPHSQSMDLKARQEAAAEQEAREALPGLLIFRDGYDPSEDLPTTQVGDCYLHHKPLFVFVVGETPTGGVRKKQFRNTLQLLREIRGPQALPLRILGPSFSGSLDSLASLLRQDAAQPADKNDKSRGTGKTALAPIFIYSGTVTGRSTMDHFKGALAPVQGHFASFIENDDYTLAQFILFAGTQGFLPQEIAVLSEDDTEYGTPRQPERRETERHERSADKSVDSDVVHLHFPREISYFRSAYQQQIAAQPQQSSSTPKTSGAPTLPLDLNESGNDDDSVPPYSVALTTLSQESAMLGVVSELHKHHIKFTILLASDPSDELFLARYLRTAYPQGRVVVTSPDLLLCREEDTLLHGVLGLNTYPLLPDLDDSVGQYLDGSDANQGNPHEDRLFVSSLSVGEYNAMLGLLAMAPTPPSATGEKPGGAAQKRSAVAEASVPQSLPDDGRLLEAPYAEYAPPAVRTAATAGTAGEAPHKPLLWLTILGRDGYWPIVALSRDNLVSADGREPIVSLTGSPNIPSTLRETTAHLLPQEKKPSDTPPSWNLAFCLCLLVLVLHAILSWKGSVFADSESRAQFARDDKDGRGAIIIALGAFALSSAFVLILLTRSVQVSWGGGWLLTVLLWLLYVAFVAVTFRDLSQWRAQPRVGLTFLIGVAAMTALQLGLAVAPPDWARVYWSTRLIHLDSGLSPVLPVLLLLAGGYWWMWMSLRAVALVDLRRPRLPQQRDLGDKEADDVIRPKLPYAQDLNAVSHRISDDEAEQLRTIAHPFFVKWQVVIPVVSLFAMALTVLDLQHPIQTIEGRGYDWGYTVLLCVLVGTFLGSLLKLVFSWMKCRQILAGLDRLPLREAFGRMKDLSWHSFWNPGGSTLRETYKIMSRTLQNLERLKPFLEAKCPTVSGAGRAYVCAQIDAVFEKRDQALEKYHELFETAPAASAQGPAARGVAALLQRCMRWTNSIFDAEANRASKEQALMKTVEGLQRQIAKAAAAVIRYALVPFWIEEPLPVVSVDERIKKEDLPPMRVLAEEFAALAYVNFLVSVLLRLRTFVICAIGLYVCIVLSISVYPFEPHPALQALAVILLIAAGVAVGYVYAEMHREPILSKLTSTPVGELGWDFWLKLAAAGAIPIFSLLAVQFPGINKLLFTWLEPALNAVK